jgi:hypothetical protein
VASADDNQDGILGNLPRSRPGVRSDKRDRGRTGARKAPAKAQAKPRTTAAKPKPAAARKPAPQSKAPASPPTAPPREPTRSSDPIEQAVHLAGEVAEVGIRAVAKVAGGVLRRLPRP